MTIHIFFSIFLFTACQSELPELSRAKEQYAQGAKLEALQMYEDIIKRYPNHSSAAEAKQLLETMYVEAAKSAALENPSSAYKIAQKQLRTFPNGAKAKETKSFIEEIQPKALLFEKKQKAELELCTQAKSSNDISLWRRYLQEYPSGVCARKADDEIRELDKKQCANARKGSPTLWRTYLENFPQGLCHKEAEQNSVRKEITNEQISVLDPHLKECSRLAEKCPRLHERYKELIQKNEMDYLRGSYYAYLKNWLAAYNDSAKLGKDALMLLGEEGYDISSLEVEYNETCVQACAQNQNDFTDLKACILAFDAQSSEQWKDYTQKFPKGACVAIARP